MTRERRSTRPSTDDLPPGFVVPLWTNEALESLGDRYPEWTRALPRDEPVYAIPEDAIEGLALTRVFGSETLAAERAFSRACREHGIVGVWGRYTVAYHLLTRQPLLLDNSIVRKLGWNHRQLGMIRGAAGLAEVAADRLRGVVGWLMTEPPFLAELAGLRGRYEALPAADRPQFPLGRVVILNDPGTLGTELPASTSAFTGDLRQFLDRWGLMQLTTWDLPDPQGPLLPDMLPAGAPARPVHGVHLFVPIHFPLQGDDDLLSRVREFQRQQATELGLAPGFGGVAHHAQYAQMFRLIHLDRTVRGRFGNRPPRGIITALEAAAASFLGIGGESVHRLWKWIRACKHGDRQTIRKLSD